MQKHRADFLKRLFDVFDDLDENENWVQVAENLILRYGNDRNPNVPPGCCATAREIHAEVELLIVHYKHVSRIDVVTVSERYGIGDFDAVSFKSAGTASFCNLGIAPYTDGSWRSDCLTVVNTPQKRRAVVGWLLSQGGQAALSAAKIVEKFPHDFPTKAAVKDGKLVAVLIDD